MSDMLIGLCMGAIPSAERATLSDTDCELYSLLLGAEGDEGSEGSSGSEGADSDEDDEDDEDEDDTTSTEDVKPPADPAEAKRLAKKNKRLRDRLKELDGQVQALQKEKDTAANAGKDETERLRGEVQTLQAKLEEAQASLQQGSLKQSFLESNKVQWHDAKTAFKLLDTSDIDIDEDGDTSGMDDAIELLAKQHPYLVKSSKSDDDKGKGKDKPKGSSGEGGTKQRKSKDGIDRDALRRKYPALN